MGASNLKMKGRFLRQRDSWLFSIFAFICLIVDVHGTFIGASSSTQNNELKREIEALTDLVEIMEARHETLEAATEQFRLKAKDLQEQQQQEKAHYESILEAKKGVEDSLREEILQVQETENARFLSLQSELGSLKLERNELEGRLQEAIFQIDILESEKNAIAKNLRETKHDLDSLVTKQEYLESLNVAREEDTKRIKELNALIQVRDIELTKSRALYADLRKELLDTATRLYSLEEDKKKEISRQERNGGVEEETTSQSNNLERLYEFFKTIMYYGGKLIQFTKNFVHQNVRPDTQSIVSNIINNNNASHAHDGLYESTAEPLTGNFFEESNTKLYFFVTKVLFALLAIDFVLSKFLTLWLQRTNVTRKRSVPVVPVEVISFENRPSRTSLLQESHFIKGSKSWRSGSGSGKSLNLRLDQSKSFLSTSS